MPYSGLFFVTNLEPDADITRLLRIAKALRIRAWAGRPKGGLGGEIGFYVHPSHRNLQTLWECYGSDG